MAAKGANDSNRGNDPPLRLCLSCRSSLYTTSVAVPKIRVFGCVAFLVCLGSLRGEQKALEYATHPKTQVEGKTIKFLHFRVCCVFGCWLAPAVQFEPPGPKQQKRKFAQDKKSLAKGFCWSKFGRSLWFGGGGSPGRGLGQSFWKIQLGPPEQKKIQQKSQPKIPMALHTKTGKKSWRNFMMRLCAQNCRKPRAQKKHICIFWVFFWIGGNPFFRWSIFVVWRFGPCGSNWTEVARTLLLQLRIPNTQEPEVAVISSTLTVNGQLVALVVVP